MTPNLKVYVVIANDGEEYETVEWFDGVFSTEKKAKEHIRKRKKECGANDYFAEIIESEVQ